MNANEYNARKAAAEQDLDRHVEAWCQKPALPKFAKAIGMTAGLLATAACIGFFHAGETCAMVVPVLLTLPALCFGGHASGLSDDENTVRELNRAKGIRRGWYCQRPRPCPRAITLRSPGTTHRTPVR